MPHIEELPDIRHEHSHYHELEHICTPDCEHNKQAVEEIANELFAEDIHAEHICTPDCEHNKQIVNELADDLFGEEEAKESALFQGAYDHETTEPSVPMTQKIDMQQQELLYKDIQEQSSGQYVEIRDDWREQASQERRIVHEGNKHESRNDKQEVQQVVSETDSYSSDIPGKGKDMEIPLNTLPAASLSYESQPLKAAPDRSEKDTKEHAVEFDEAEIMDMQEAITDLEPRDSVGKSGVTTADHEAAPEDLLIGVEDTSTGIDMIATPDVVDLQYDEDVMPSESGFFWEKEHAEEITEAPDIYIPHLLTEEKAQPMFEDMKEADETLDTEEKISPFLEWSTDNKNNVESDVLKRQFEPVVQSYENDPDVIVGVLEDILLMRYTVTEEREAGMLSHKEVYDKLYRLAEAMSMDASELFEKMGINNTSVVFDTAFFEKLEALRKLFYEGSFERIILRQHSQAQASSPQKINQQLRFMAKLLVYSVIGSKELRAVS